MKCAVTMVSESKKVIRNIYLPLFLACGREAAC